MAMPETFEEFIEMYSYNTRENNSKGRSNIIESSTVLKAWEHYRQKEYEKGSVRGYINCIDDHGYKPEFLNLSLSDSESLKLRELAEALNMEYPEVIERAINTVYMMVGERNE